MRIAVVFDSLSIGGIESVGLNYIKLMLEMGHNVDVFNLHPDQDDMVCKLDKTATYIPFRFDRKICPDLYSYGIKKWWWAKYAYPILYPVLSLALLTKKKYSNEKYDIAIAFSGHINDLTFIAKHLINAKKKIVWCHGTLLSYLAICDAYPVLYRMIDTIVNLSDQGQHNVYAGHSFLHEKEIKTIYNPVFIRCNDVDENKVDALKKKYGDFVLMIARATPQKDHKTAIDAIKILNRNGLKKKIVFVGDGELLPEIRKYAEENGVAEYCVFEGNKYDVQNYIKASFIGLLASNYEGLPTVIAESMAFGKPCVMTKSDGGEISGNGQYCLLTEIGNADEIAKCLFKLYSEEKTYEKYSQLALKRFEKFDPNNIKIELQSILKISD